VKGRGYRLTERAAADIEGILGYTLQQFGPMQTEAYGKLLDKAVEMVAHSPVRLGARVRDELGQGVRSFHVEIAAARRGAASHIIYYVVGSMEDGSAGTIILRVLWEGMDPRRHLARALDERESE
jgi:toxin ParE1/3/4